MVHDTRTDSFNFWLTQNHLIASGYLGNYIPNIWVQLADPANRLRNKAKIVFTTSHFCTRHQCQLPVSFVWVGIGRILCEKARMRLWQQMRPLVMRFLRYRTSKRRNHGRPTTHLHPYFYRKLKNECHRARCDGVRSDGGPVRCDVTESALSDVSSRETPGSDGVTVALWDVTSLNLLYQTLALEKLQVRMEWRWCCELWPHCAGRRWRNCRFRWRTAAGRGGCWVGYWHCAARRSRDSRPVQPAALRYTQWNGVSHSVCRARLITPGLPGAKRIFCLKHFCPYKLVSCKLTMASLCYAVWIQKWSKLFSGLIYKVRAPAKPILLSLRYPLPFDHAIPGLWQH